MRRIRCIVCFTGGAFDVPVTPAANRQRVTVDDLVRQLQEQESVARGAPFRIDVVTDGSGTYGPARGLAPDDELPSATDPANVFLVFAPKYVDRFPRSKIDTAARVNEHHARQVLAYGCALAPAHEHMKASLAEYTKAAACAESIAADFEARRAELPAAMDALAAVTLVSDPETTLAARVGDLTALVDAGGSELAHARTGLAQMKLKYDDIEQRLKQSAAVVPPAAASASQAHIDSMAKAIEGRLEELKALLKSTERARLEVAKLLQGVKAVRDGVLLKMSMVATLPEAYDSAIALARRRLTFNKAALRLRQMLAIEHSAICESTAAFVAQFGARFPTNIVPGIATKPPLPMFDDPVADVMRPHMFDLDEDPVSELLARLGLGRERARDTAPATPATTAEPDAAAAAAEAERARLVEAHEEEMSQLKAELAALRRDAETAAAAHRQDRDELAMVQLRAADAEAEAARARQERAMFAEARDTLQRRVEKLEAQLSDSGKSSEEAEARVDHLQHRVKDLEAQLNDAADDAAAATDRAKSSEAAMRDASSATEARMRELAAQVEALQTSLENADVAARASEEERADLQEKLTQLAAEISERSDEIDEAAAQAAEAKQQAAAEARLRQLLELENEEATARGNAIADAFTDRCAAVHAAMQAAVRRSAVGATSPAPSALSATANPTRSVSPPTTAPSPAAAGDGSSALFAAEDSSTSFGAPIRLAPDTLPVLEATHTSPSGVLDRDALNLAVFEELRLRQRPLKFTPTTVRGSALWRDGKQYLDATRAGFTVRAVCDGATAKTASERARRDGFVFGEVVFITNIQRQPDGTVIVSGPVSFSKE